MIFVSLSIAKGNSYPSFDLPTSRTPDLESMTESATFYNSGVRTTTKRKWSFISPSP